MEANLARADDRIVEINVAYWHKCELPTASSNVRVRGQSGKHMLAVSSSHFDPERTLGRFWLQLEGRAGLFARPPTIG